LDPENSEYLVHDCGEMNQVCQMCKAAYFALESNANGSFGNCCRKGSIRLALVTPGSTNFKNLLLSLKSKVRQYTYICAEFPDPQNNELYQTVVNCMIHSKCGIHNPSAKCMVNGNCSKGFPKKFNPAT
jgi:hypothetical protein